MPKASDYRQAARQYRSAQQSRARRQEIDAAVEAYYAARDATDAERRAAADRLYELDPRNPIFTD